MAAKAESKSVGKTLENSKKYRLVVGGLIAIGILYLLKGIFVVAIVNGSPIWRYSVIRQLESQGGSEVVEGMITQKLIDQEARERGISVLPKEVDQEIEIIRAELVAQNQELEQVLAMQSMTMENLREQIRVQKIVENVFSEETTISDEEIASYLETYGSSIDAEMSDEEKRELVTNQLQQQKLAESFYGWIEGLREGAQINFLVEY